MGTPNKKDILAAFDIEINLMSDSVKSDDFKTWALILGLGAVLSLLSAEWESGSQELKLVSFLFLGFIMIGEVLQKSKVLRLETDYIFTLFQPRRLPIGIPFSPMLFGILVTVLLAILLFLRRNLLPIWIVWVTLFLLFLKLITLIIGLFVFKLVTNPTKLWKKTKCSRYFIRGRWGGFCCNKYYEVIEWIIFLILTFSIFSEIFSIKSSVSLSTVRFAFLSYISVCIMAAILQPTPLKDLPNLIKLRRQLFADKISSEDAYWGLTLTQLGVKAVLMLINDRQEIIATVNALLKDLKDFPQLLEEYLSLDPAVRNAHPIALKLQDIENMVMWMSSNIEIQKELYPGAGSELDSFFNQIKQKSDSIQRVIEGKHSLSCN